MRKEVKNEEKGNREKADEALCHRMGSLERIMGCQALIKFFHTCFAGCGEQQTVVLVRHPGSHWWSDS